MCVFSPVIYYIIKYLRELFLFVVAIWWLQIPHNAFIPQTILFFSLGSYFSVLEKNPMTVFLHLKKWYLVLFFVFAISDMMAHTICITPINLQIHRLALIFNIPAFFLLADYCCRHGNSSLYLSNAAFIVFSVHYPIVVLMRKICATKLGEMSDLLHIPLYFICAVIAAIISLLIYTCLDKYCPKLKNILSGNR